MTIAKGRISSSHTHRATLAQKLSMREVPNYTPKLVTVREELIDRCMKLGMPTDHAETVVNLAIPVINDSFTCYSITWDRPNNEYAEIVYMIMFMYVKQVATKYIKEHIPHAWFAPMFDMPKLSPDMMD